MKVLPIALSLLTTPAAAGPVNVLSARTDFEPGGYCSAPNLGGICVWFAYNQTNPDQCGK